MDIEPFTYLNELNLKWAFRKDKNGSVWDWIRRDETLINIAKYMQ